MRDAVDGVRALFLMPGYVGQRQILADARAAGVERVVMLSGGSAGTGDTSNAVAAYLIDAEAAVRASGLPWTFLRATSFMSNALRLADQIRKGDTVRVPFPDACTPTSTRKSSPRSRCAPCSWTTTRAAPSTSPTPRRCRPPTVSGSSAGYRAATCDPFGLSHEEARTERESRMPAAYVDAFFRFFAVGTLDESVVLPTVQEVTGGTPRTFEQWVRAHADAFRGA